MKTAAIFASPNGQWNPKTFQEALFEGLVWINYRFHRQQVMTQVAAVRIRCEGCGVICTLGMRDNLPDFTISPIVYHKCPACLRSTRLDSGYVCKHLVLSYHGQREKQSRDDA